MVCLPVVWAVIGGEMGVDRVGVHAIMVPLWFHTDAMATLTLKNIPDELHAKLKESAERNRRSLNSEILVRLESAFAAPLVDGREEARRLKAFTDRQPFLDHALIDSFKRRGRM